MLQNPYGAMLDNAHLWSRNSHHPKALINEYFNEILTVVCLNIEGLTAYL